jgi:hypothetical protein
MARFELEATIDSGRGLLLSGLVGHTLVGSSANDYVREAAVQALALLGHGDASPILLERANDWVPEVRRAATQRSKGSWTTSTLARSGGVAGAELQRSPTCNQWSRCSRER